MCYGTADHRESLHGKFRGESGYISAPPPRVWMRYLDDIFVVINKDYAQQFTNHIYSLNQHINFTNDPVTEGTLSVPFGSVPFVSILPPTGAQTYCDQDFILSR